ncbi:MAG: hypothetical protein HKO53_20440, partial [Gemmatimonadetes bacterium]|nr:hypothetical protein [Gemmatimonadota bacterium]
PRVVVDDCALSGLRFQESLADLPGDGPVVFAPLLSHPDLRARIVATEARVERVVSARDLDDRAPALLGPGYDAWKERWDGRRLQGYWTGVVDHVVFPWSEPDVAVWDPSAGKTVHGWRVAGAERCLKNRMAFQARRDRLQVNRPAEGGHVPPEGVVYAEIEGDLVLADLATGRTVRLGGSAPSLWRGLVDTGNLPEAEAALAAQIELEPEALGRELAEFAAQMVEWGFLVAPP